jgi:NitT/TauT family transport system substrate-binding protein
VKRSTALAAFAAASLAGPQALCAQDLPKLVVAGVPIDDFKTVMYGIRSGLFRRHGLNVDVTWVNSGAASLAAVVGGSVQIAFTSLPALIQAHLRGLSFRIVAPAQLYLSEAASTALYVKKDSTIRSGADLNGKTISVQSIRDLSWVVTLAWIDQNGGDSSTVKAVELPISAVAAAIAEGRIAAGGISSPFAEQGVAAGQVRMLAKNYDAIAKRYQASAFVSTSEYIAANTDAMQRWSRAMRESILYTNTHLRETVDLVAQYSGADPAVVARSVRAIDPEYLDPKEIQPVIDIAFKYKMIDRAFSAEELISPTALRAPR